jgi:hypothetical protein
VYLEHNSQKWYAEILGLYKSCICRFQIPGSLPFFIMSTVPDGIYNITNVSTGLLAVVAQNLVAPYTPVIAWNASGAGDGEKVTFALLSHLA